MLAKVLIPFTSHWKAESIHQQVGKSLEQVILSIRTMKRGILVQPVCGLGRRSKVVIPTIHLLKLDFLSTTRSSLIIRFLSPPDRQRLLACNLPNLSFLAC